MQRVIMALVFTLTPVFCATCAASGDDSTLVRNNKDLRTLSGNETSIVFTSILGQAELELEDLRSCLKLCEPRSLTLVCPACDDAWLIEIANEQSVESLGVIGASSLTRKGVEALRQLTKLKKLHLSAKSLGEGSLEPLASFEKLEDLSLGAGAPGQVAGFRNLPNHITSLALTGFYLGADQVNGNWPQSLATLRLDGVEFGPSVNLPSESLVGLIELLLNRVHPHIVVTHKTKLPCLRKLSITHCDLLGLDHSVIESYQRLEEVDFSGSSSVDRELLEAMSSAPIEKLKMAFCKDLDGSCLRGVARFNSLKQLVIVGARGLSKSAGACIGSLSLTDLTLRDCDLDDSVFALALQSSIATLDASWSPRLTVKAWQVIADCAPKVSILNLEGCVGIDRVEQASLGQMENLKEVDVSDTYCRDDSLIALAKTGVLHLDVGRTLITIGGIRAIAKLDLQLETLTISGCPQLTNKDVAETRLLLSSTTVSD